MSLYLGKKIKEWQIRFRIWWENTGFSSSKFLKIGGIVAGILGLGLVFYGIYSWWWWNSSRRVIPAEIAKERESMPTPDPEAEKTYPSPINGVFYTHAEQDVFSSRRPLAIMVNNHPQARPQFGLSKADLVYEVVAEGGITRFLAVFHSQDVEKVGPVRSARTYYLDWAAELYAWFAHWGGSYMDADDEANQYNPNYSFTCHPDADSYAKINRINLPSLDQMWLGSSAYWRDNSRGVPQEHTGFTSTTKLWNVAPTKYPGWEGLKKFDPWKFKDDDTHTGGTPAQAPSPQEETERPSSVESITFNFWENPQFLVNWEHDSEENAYRRYQGGEPTIDAGAGDVQIQAKNVVLQFVKETLFNDQKKHLRYQTVGEGSAYIFLDGKVIKGTWEKDDIYGRTRFYDSAGKEVKFNRGQIWIEIVPARNKDLVKLQ